MVVSIELKNNILEIKKMIQKDIGNAKIYIYIYIFY